MASNPAAGLPTSGTATANGATVTISDSVITGNRADPVRAVPSGITCPGGFPPVSARSRMAAGGGIDSWGYLRLVHTAVIGNSVGPAAGLPAVRAIRMGQGSSVRRAA